MTDQPDVIFTRRVCKYCGAKFRARKHEAMRRGCPECEPPPFSPDELREWQRELAEAVAKGRVA